MFQYLGSVVFCLLLSSLHSNGRSEKHRGWRKSRLVAVLEDLDSFSYNVAVQLERQSPKRLIEVEECSLEILFAFHRPGRLIHLSNVPHNDFEIPPFAKLPASHHKWLADVGMDASFIGVVAIFNSWWCACSQSDGQQFAGQRSLFSHFSHSCLLETLSYIASALCKKPFISLLMMHKADLARRPLEKNRSSALDEMLGFVLRRLEARDRHFQQCWNYLLLFRVDI